MQLKTHPVVNLIVGKCDVILEGRIPFLERNLPPIRTSLGSDELLEIAHSVIRATFDAH